jgi:starch-binding outer membrane protein, SusD/RagB family
MTRTTSKLGRAARAIVVPLGFAVAVASCDSILETAPMGALNDQTFYRTHSHFSGATLGAYSTLLNYAWEQSGNGLFKGAYMPDDDAQCKPGGWPGGCDEDRFNWNSGNPHFTQFWRESYKGIMRTNMIIESLPTALDVDQAERNRFEGEARFLRAYFYFFLARHFADPNRPSIPLIVERAKMLDDIYRSPAPTAEVWDLIESDLVFAAQNLPGKQRWITENQVGRATKGAANALLGKVRVYRAQWLGQPGKYQEAIDALEAVVQSGEYSLVADYSHNFVEAHQNNPESIFEVQMSEGTDINGWDPVDSGYGSASYSRDIAWGPGCWEGQCEPWGGGRSYGLLQVTPSLQNFYERVTVGGEVHEDPRRYHTVLLHGEPLYVGAEWAPMGNNFNGAWSPTRSIPSKYLRPMLLDTYAENRYHVNDYNNDRLIRYADVLLLLAEAELLGNNNVPRATQLINMVRERARQSFDILHGRPTPAGLLQNKAAVSHADIRSERRAELAFEGHRYDDLVRWHRAQLINIKVDIDFSHPEANANWAEKHLLKPIPQVELDRNGNLSQNVGY